MKRKFFLGSISLALALCLCITACGGLTIRDNGDGSYTVTPNEGNGNNQGNQQGGNNQGSTEPSAPDYSMYSPLLQEVLNDPQWDALYRRYKSNELYESSQHFDVGTNLLEAVPYKYLESEGEDIDGIKNGAVAVGSYLYFLENDKNNIYDKVNVIYKVPNGENYINQYLLKYRITEQELKDLTMLYSGDYYQGPIMFQCLAAKQQPEVIAEFSITENAYEKVLSVCNSTSQYATLSKLLDHDKISSFTLTSLDYGIVWDETSYDINFNLINEGDFNGSVSQKTLYKVSSSLIYSTSKVSYINGLLDLEWFSGINSTILSSTPITYFHLSHSFKDF